MCIELIAVRISGALPGCVKQRASDDMPDAVRHVGRELFELSWIRPNSGASGRFAGPERPGLGARLDSAIPLSCASAHCQGAARSGGATTTPVWKWPARPAPSGSDAARAIVARCRRTPGKKRLPGLPRQDRLIGGWDRHRSPREPHQGVVGVAASSGTATSAAKTRPRAAT